MNDQFYDRVDEQGQLHLGAWRWVSRCPLCGTMVYERAESRVVDVICPQVKTVIIRRYPESSPVTKPRSKRTDLRQTKDNVKGRTLRDPLL